MYASARIAASRRPLPGLHRPFSSSSGPPPASVLHSEWIHGGRVGSDLPSGGGGGTVVFLHGLLGSGKNLRMPAKRLTVARPDLTALLFDLRGHGQTSARGTLGRVGGVGGNTLAALADDVVRTVRHLGLVGPRGSPVGIVGHSLGGRVALEYVRALQNGDLPSAGGGGSEVQPPGSAWILDSVPGQAHASVADVVKAISGVPLPVASKRDLVEELVDRRGVSNEIALWMTTNLVKAADGNGFVWAFDLDIANDLLEDFPAQDFFGLVRGVGAKFESFPSRINVVMAGKTEAWTPSVVGELGKIREKSPPSTDPFLNMHWLPEAGHNVHVDDLDGLMKLLESGFRQ